METQDDRPARPWVILLAIVVVAGFVAVAFAAQPDGDGSVSTDASPGFDADGLPIDTSPFELASPRVDGSTTLPIVPGANGTDPPQTTTPPETSTTLPLPGIDPTDLRCIAASDIIRGLRAMTEPGGSLADNFALASGALDLAASRIDQVGGDGAAPTAALLREVARLIPSAPDEEAAVIIYERFSRSEDPVVQSFGAGFAAHLQAECPELLTLEP